MADMPEHYIYIYRLACFLHDRTDPKVMSFRELADHLNRNQIRQEGGEPFPHGGRGMAAIVHAVYRRIHGLMGETESQHVALGYVSGDGEPAFARD